MFPKRRKLIRAASYYGTWMTKSATWQSPALNQLQSCQDNLEGRVTTKGNMKSRLACRSIGITSNIAQPPKNHRVTPIEPSTAPMGTAN